MLGATHVEVYVAPVFVGRLAHQRLVVVRIHVAQIVGTRPGEARHGVEVDGEHRLLVDETVLHYAVLLGVPGPFLGAAQWRLARLGGLILLDLGQFDGQTLLGNHARDATLVVHRERLAPVSLAREDGIADAEVHLHASDALVGHKLLGGGDGLLHGQAVQAEAVEALLTLGGRIDDDALLGVEALLRHVGTLDERHDGQAEMAGKGIVAAVVGRHGHDGARAISGQHILGNPDGDGLAGEGVDGIRTREHARHLAVGHAVELRALLHIVEILVHLGLLLGCGDLRHIVRLGGQHHERHAEHRVGASGKDGKLQVTVLHLELHLSTLAASYPVFLRLGDRVAPVYGVEAVEQTLCVGRHSQAPLAHLLLHHWESAAHRHAVHHLVVGQHRAQPGTPVDHRLALVGNAIVHQRVALLLLVHGVPFLGGESQRIVRLCHVQSLGARSLETADELADGLCLLQVVVVVRLEHTLEGPLRPVVVARVAGAYLAVPVEAEPDLVELLAIVVDIVLGGDSRMLSCLNGILLGRQSVGIVAHGVENIVALQPLVARIDVAGDIAQRMTHVQSGTRGVGEHIEHVEFLAVGVLHHLIGLLVHPTSLPFLFNFFEIVIHCNRIVFIFLPSGIDNCKVSGKKQEAQTNIQKKHPSPSGVGSFKQRWSMR